MDLGLFLMPQAAPERTVFQTARYIKDVLIHGDQLGYREGWIGEHFACGWEPVPAPDLLIAQLIESTEQMVFAPGAHVLPYHHPVELAHRVAYLDHLAQGRYILGIGTGSVPMDADLFGAVVREPDGSIRLNNAEMMREALDIMLKIWTADEGFEHQGKYWQFVRRDWDEHEQGPFLKPFQQPHPPIGMCGLSVSSSTLAHAGQLGFLPLSFSFGGDYLANHWNTYAEEAAKAGHRVNRSSWRITSPVMVADSNEEAVRLASTGEMGRFWTSYMVPGMLSRGIMKFVKVDPNHADESVDVDYMARNTWPVGTPEQVAERIVELFRSSGGFGMFMPMVFDFMDDPKPWLYSMELIKHEVMPLVNAEIGSEYAAFASA
jgi:alkanesulfonate monooxygenase SsuD/methylene tetrahydromethanopterin reductase-like flavin-dependent oxidoreductase (luciferase family)